MEHAGNKEIFQPPLPEFENVLHCHTFLEKAAQTVIINKRIEALNHY